MKYERQKIRQSFWEGVTLWQKPNLPKVEFKKNKVTYKITDVRCLYEPAVDTFMDVLSCVCSKPCKEVTYDVTEIEDDKIDLIADIVTGIDCEYKSRGRSGQVVFLATGCRLKETDEGKKFLTFELAEENAKAIYEYAQANAEAKKGVFNYLELAIVVVDASRKQMEEVLNNEMES